MTGSWRGFAGAQTSRTAMAKKSSKPAKKRSAKPNGRARPASSAARTAKRPARRSTKVARTTRRKASLPRRSSTKRMSRSTLHGKKRPAPRAGGRRLPKAKTSLKSRKQAKLVEHKKSPKLASKALPKVAPKLAKTTPKIPSKAQTGPAKAGVAPTAPVKPSAGEIAARLSARRTEKALAEGKVRSGKNGGVELRKVELTPAEAEARKTRLKNLIVLGKERSYLTYAEINDHLPADILDAEQIEGIISMINDMGIQVYDEAPDAETLLMSEAAPTAPAEDVEEAAEAAVSTLDSEFGRTTDPVRMYMREMGSVELLTREGEIEIAKRIEEGLKHMIMAISACPMTVGPILDLDDKVDKDELKIDDIVDGLMAFNEQLASIDESDAEIDEEEDEGDAGAIAAENLERLKVAALERFATIRKFYTRMLAVLQKEGHKAPKYLELQKKISAELM